MAITTIIQLRAKVEEASQSLVLRSIAGANQANSYIQTFTGNLGYPQGVTPSSGVAGNTVDNTTVGAFPIPLVSSGDLYLIDVNIRAFWQGTLMVYDRLWHNSGLSVTTTTAQTVNSVALPARANGGIGAELWLDSYGAMGAGVFSSCTVTYTNTGSTGSRTATVVGASASATAGKTYPFSLNAGDVGIQSIQSFTLGTSRTSGTHGLVLRRPLARIPLEGSTSRSKVDAFDIPMCVIPDDACIEFIFHSGLVGPTANVIGAGTLNFVEA